MKQRQRVIVTGAGRGIGRAIAMELARHGHSVAVVSRTASQVEETVREIESDPQAASSGGRALAVPTDVTGVEQVETMVRRTLDTFGGLDAVINNAGSFQSIGPTWETDPETFWQDITINVRGPYLVCRAVMPHLIAAGSGTIINMIGGGTGDPMPYGNAYGTSKAALMRFTESLAAEAKEHRISVFATNPGLVRTAMTQYQLDSDAGKRWMSRIAQAFDNGVDRPPADASLLVRRLVEGDFLVLTGRRFGPDDDPAEVIRDVDRILAEDLRTLRLRG